MLFSERQKLEKEYYKWLEENPNVKPCPFSVISFLDINKNLVSNDDFKKIEVLEKALELACVDILSYAYPNRDFNNYKPKTTMKRYKQMAQTILKGENNG